MITKSNNQIGKNIVLVLGNGFDISMGRRTTYKDFYNSEYCPNDYPAPLISYLNDKWKEDIEDVRWYDLENELLNYYKKISDPNYDKLNHDVINDLEKNCIKNIEPYYIPFGLYNEKYGEQIETLYAKGIIKRERIGYSIPYKEDLLKPPHFRDKKALELIKNKLCLYLKDLDDLVPNQNSLPLDIVKSLLPDNLIKNSLNIYSFNYTSIPRDSVLDKMPKVHYVHGCCSKEQVIIGTGDEDITDEYSFLQKSFDNKFSPPPIVDDLDSADEIVIYGHSLGYNDKQYFKPFFKKQSGEGALKRKDIIIITKDDSSEEDVKRSLQKMTDNNLSLLMTRNNVKFIKMDTPYKDNKDLSEFFASHGMPR
ncbi:MAG: bacteriophage abortive infection AbiH family protein [Bacteroidales bacterium]|nr:bacteriophage abortive infection AbiH family protein [Bacteroidales bacterium]